MHAVWFLSSTNFIPHYQVNYYSHGTYFQFTCIYCKKLRMRFGSLISSRWQHLPVKRLLIRNTCMECHNAGQCPSCSTCTHLQYFTNLIIMHLVLDILKIYLKIYIRSMFILCIHSVWICTVQLNIYSLYHWQNDNKPFFSYFDFYFQVYITVFTTFINMTLNISMNSLKYKNANIINFGHWNVHIL